MIDRGAIRAAHAAINQRRSTLYGPGALGTSKGLIDYVEAELKHFGCAPAGYQSALSNYLRSYDELFEGEESSERHAAEKWAFVVGFTEAFLLAVVASGRQDTSGSRERRPRPGASRRRGRAA